MALKAFSSQLITGAGISMGDEGKGRLMYEVLEDLKELTGEDDPVSMILKVNGGANSGHTAAGLKHNLLPSGITDTSIAYLGVGMGVVADPRKFLWEALPLEDRGFTVLDRLFIDERTMVSDLTHRLLDLAWEDYRVYVLNEPPRGSTGRGITPAYSDEVNQQQIFYHEFLGPKEAYSQKLSRRADRALDMIQHVCRVTPERWASFFDILTEAETRANQESINAGIFSADEFDFTQFKGAEPYTLNFERLLEVYWSAGTKLGICVGNVPEKVLSIISNGKYLIGEFGQSYWLDKRRGFTPNVTASHTFTPELFQSAGIPAQPVHNVGVCKAYDTKVGTHIFLTQLEEEHPLSPILKKLEFGTSTGRQRMVGWYDAVEKGEALKYGGFQDLVINKIDALGHEGDWKGDLKICTAYRDPDGKIVRHVPRNEEYRRSLTPIYEEIPGWAEDISSVRSFQNLPIEAQRYVAVMVRSTLDIAYPHGYPESLPHVRFVGIGPMPGQILRDLPTTEDLVQGST
ncbi:MAG: adenylosuccinate synthase [Verrucomicrobia bacterium]|nr:adenylosuccinate synthase [Verrucomicrobiota bacterium]